jgi:hypothetical protein
MLTIPGVVDSLVEVFGEPTPPPRRTLVELVVWENVAYLADDAARSRAFELLRTRIGLRPEQLRAASDYACQQYAAYPVPRP